MGCLEQVLLLYIYIYIYIYILPKFLNIIKSDNTQRKSTMFLNYLPFITIYFKLPFLKLSDFTQRKVRMLAKKYCNNLNIKLAFSSFKIKNLLAVKDRVNKSLRSCVVYKFTCAGCNSVYIGETSRHLST